MRFAEENVRLAGKVETEKSKNVELAGKNVWLAGKVETEKSKNVELVDKIIILNWFF